MWFFNILTKSTILYNTLKINIVKYLSLLSKYSTCISIDLKIAQTNPFITTLSGLVKGCMFKIKSIEQSKCTCSFLGVQKILLILGHSHSTCILDKIDRCILLIKTNFTLESTCR